MTELRRPELEVSIKNATHDVNRIKKEFNRRRGENLVKQLEKKRYNAYYVENKDEAAKLVYDLIPTDSIIGVGDSHSFYSLDLEDDLKSKNCKLIPNVAALNLHGYELANGESFGYIKAPTREEARDILADYLTANVFVLSANAITAKGEIVNVDGVGNRIAGSLYGADRMIMIIGVNKIVKDEKAARERIEMIAGPMNNIKYHKECPSVKTGICPHCTGEESICNITCILHKCPTESDYNVIIVGEELGF